MFIKVLKDKLDMIHKVGKPIQIIIDYDGHGNFWTKETYREVCAEEYEVLSGLIPVYDFKEK